MSPRHGGIQLRDRILVDQVGVQAIPDPEDRRGRAEERDTCLGNRGEDVDRDLGAGMAVLAPKRGGRLERVLEITDLLE